MSGRDQVDDTLRTGRKIMNARPVSSTVSSALTAAMMLAAGALAITGCTGDTPLNNNNQNNGSYRCPSGYLLVPGGTFTMGVDAEDVADLEGTDWSPIEGPAHKVTLSSDFCKSKTEVTET